ncbi:MAG: pilus assembly protein [Proteobacteria bacterium]|nr:pilus assembly protein [Pseudomonadota bacterium]
MMDLRKFLDFRRFGAARSGLAALEFAIILPMMVFLLLGSVDLLDALSVNRRAENVAASLADVVARDTAVSNSEMSGIWSALTLLMYPGTDATMSERVTSINITSATNAVVVWSEAQHGISPLAANSTVTLPAQMMVAGTSVIRADTVYHYQSPLNFLYSGTIDFPHTVYRRSRLVDPIPRVP